MCVIRLPAYLYTFDGRNNVWAQTRRITTTIAARVSTLSVVRCIRYAYTSCSRTTCVCINYIVMYYNIGTARAVYTIDRRVYRTDNACSGFTLTRRVLCYVTHVLCIYLPEIHHLMNAFSIAIP